MVPPGDIFDTIPIAIGVILATVIALGLHGYLLQRRVFALVLMGRKSARFDQPLKRLWNAFIIVMAQWRVLRSVSIRRFDMAGIAHALIFWSFLSFNLGYVLLKFGDSVWRKFSQTVLTESGLQVFGWYLDIYAGVLLVVFVWALARRWVVRPHRLSFDLTRSGETVFVMGLEILLMVLWLMTEAMYVASGGTGPLATVPIGKAIGDAAASVGVDGNFADTLQGLFWWLHLFTVLSFAIYIPFSKHMHIVASPFNAFLRRLEPMGTLGADTGPRDRGELRRRSHPGLHVEGAAGRLRLRRLRTVHGQLPRQPHGQGALTHACRGGAQGVPVGAGQDRPRGRRALRPGHRGQHPGAGHLGLRHLRGLCPGVPRGCGAHRQHRGHAPPLGDGEGGNAGAGHDRAPEHGAARPPLAGHDLLPHRLDPGAGRADHGRGAGAGGAVLGGLHRGPGAA